MESPLKKIRSLIPNLPKSDIPLALECLDTHDYDRLKEIVDSDVVKVERNQRRINDELAKNPNAIPENKYPDIDYYQLVCLSSEVNAYIELVEGVLDSITSDEDGY